MFIKLYVPELDLYIARNATADADNHRQRKMIDAGDSLVILKWSKNHPEKHYLKIAILWAAVVSAKRFKYPAQNNHTYIT